MNSQINLSGQINIEAKQVLNLDTGTAIALIAENSPHRYELRQYVNGKEMVMTQTAFSEFIPIVNTIATLSEQTRANRLLQRVTIIPDNPSSRALNLKPTRKLGSNDIIILGTGDQLGIVTTTADEKAVGAATAQGVDFHVYIHLPFPLTGNKSCKSVFHHIYKVHIN